MAFGQSIIPLGPLCFVPLLIRVHHFSLSHLFVRVVGVVAHKQDAFHLPGDQSSPITPDQTLSRHTHSTLLLPSRCDLDPTTEVFGGQNYDTNWRQTAIDFPSIPPAYATQNRVLSRLGLGAMAASANAISLPSIPLVSRRFDDLIVANVGKQILLPPGGVFLGLIKFKSKDIRPTLLSQLGYSSLRFDPRGGTLTLSSRSMVPPANVSTVPTVKLVDLRTLGDPVCHYAARIKSLEINGQPVAMDSTVFAVFDTGNSHKQSLHSLHATYMLLSNPL